MTTEGHFAEDGAFYHAIDHVEHSESAIIPHLPLMLITWSPNPKGMPSKYDMIRNHKWFCRTVFRRWSSCMHTYCVLPEFNLNGNLHYHGWFQLKDAVKWFKSILPLLKRYGYVKINEARTYKVNSYEETSNALYYYKKDIIPNSIAYGLSYAICCKCDPWKKVYGVKKKRRNIENYMKAQQMDLEEKEDKDSLEAFLRLV